MLGRPENVKHREEPKEKGHDPLEKPDDFVGRGACDDYVTVIDGGIRVSDHVIDELVHYHNAKDYYRYPTWFNIVRHLLP